MAGLSVAAAAANADGDGMPDFWERQFELNPTDPVDGKKIAAGGFSNIEHYLHNSHPDEGAEPIVFVSATVSRALAGKGQNGEWQFTRTGSSAKPLPWLLNWLETRKRARTTSQCHWWSTSRLGSVPLRYVWNRWHLPELIAQW